MASDPLAPFAQIFRNAPENVGDMRRVIELFTGLLNTDLPEVGAFHAAVPVADGVTGDVIEPRGAGPHPVLVYLHGGGWVSGSPTTHRKLASRFAEAGYLVLNVDYRLAPEHPFPTPFEDCLAAVRFAAREAGRWNGDGARLAVGGDSAGGNLSASVAAALADDPACPRAALLIYGVFDFATIGDAPPKPMFGMDEATAEQLRDKLLDLMVGAYLGPESERAEKLRDPRVSPLHVADRLPPCHVMVGSADPLVAQAEDLVAALRRAGVEHEHFVDDEMPHGYAQIEMLEPTRPAIDRMIAFLGKHLGSPNPVPGSSSASKSQGSGRET